MRKIERAVSAIVLVCFLLSTAVSDLAFSQTVNYTPNTDKLAIAGKTDDMLGSEARDLHILAEQFKAALVWLGKNGIPVTVDGIKKTPDNVLGTVDGIKIFKHEAIENPDGSLIIKARRQGDKVPYVIERVPQGGFRVYPEDKTPERSRDKILKPPSILEAAEANIRAAAEKMRLDPALLEMVLKPKKITTVKFDVPLDNGEKVTFWGFRALQNDARGAGKGGLRWLVSKGETLEEAKNTAVGLATLMTVKNAVINIPYGGGKGDIFVPERSYTNNDKARIIRAFSRELTKENAIGPFIDVPAPDKGTDARMMAWFMDEYLMVLAESGLMHDKTIESELNKVTSSKNPQETSYLDKYISLLSEDKDGVLQGFELGMITGKPPLKGGSEGRAKATGFGGFLVLKAMLKHFSAVKDLSKDTIGSALSDEVRIALKKDLKQMTAAIQGTGNVGEYNAWELYNTGVKVVMLQDAVKEGSEMVQYTLHNPNGIDIELLNRNLARLADGRWASLSTLPQEFLVNTGCKLLRNDVKTFWTTHTDIKIPAATENVITVENAEDVNCEIILELANAPTTPEADKVLQKRGILVITDVLANALGVTVSYYEWLQNIEGRYWTEGSVDKMAEERVNMEVSAVLNFSEKYQVGLREAAYILSLARIVDAEIARSGELQKIFALKEPYRFYGNLGLFPDTIEELNNVIREGRFPQLVKESEELKSIEIDSIVDKVSGKFPPTETNFVLIAGPTTSGKLSLAVNIEERLKLKGKNAIRLNFDSMNTEDLKRLKYGEEIRVVDYIDGKEVERKIKPQRGDIFVVEGSLTLSDAVLGVIPQRNRLGIFVNTAPSMKLADNWPLTSLDLRLLRHILTMHHTQGEDALDVIRQWPAERAEQLQRIYPSWAKADVTFNGYLAYELPVIKFYIEDDLGRALSAAKEQKDAASIKVIERLQRTLKGVETVKSSDVIPSNSIIQQYIGGEEFYGKLKVSEEVRSTVATTNNPGAHVADLKEIMKLVPTNWLDGWLNLISFASVPGEAGCEKNIVISDDKTVLIFSEKATFGEYKDGQYEEGIGIILPSLIKSGLKIAVIATTDKQKALIDEFNEGLSKDRQIICADNIHTVMTMAKAPRYSYFKIASEPEADAGVSVTSITIIVKEILDAIGNVVHITDPKLMEQMHEAARRFAMAA